MLQLTVECDHSQIMDDILLQVAFPLSSSSSLDKVSSAGCGALLGVTEALGVDCKEAKLLEINSFH